MIRIGLRFFDASLINFGRRKENAVGGRHAKDKLA